MEDPIHRMTEEALSSLDHITRASPKPYLMTRIRARMDRSAESAWEKAGKFLSRPAVAFTGLFLVIGFNVGIMVSNNSSVDNTVNTEQQQLTADDFSTSVVSLYDTENLQP